MKKIDFEHMFTEKEITRILVKLNHASLEELQLYPAVTKAMAVTLGEQREMEPLTSLQCLLTFRG